MNITVNSATPAAESALLGVGRIDLALLVLDGRGGRYSDIWAEPALDNFRFEGEGYFWMAVPGIYEGVHVLCSLEAISAETEAAYVAYVASGVSETFVEYLS